VSWVVRARKKVPEKSMRYGRKIGSDSIGKTSDNEYRFPYFTVFAVIFLVRVWWVPLLNVIVTDKESICSKNNYSVASVLFIAGKRIGVTLN